MEVLLLHTLEWCKKYMPWCISSKAIQFKCATFIYSQGHSNPWVNQHQRLAKKNEQSRLEGYSIVWYHPGLVLPSNTAELYTCLIINILDVKVSGSLIKTML